MVARDGRTLRNSWYLVPLALALVAAVSMAQPTLALGDESASQDGTDVEFHDSISEAELEDLQAIADQSGISLQAAIDRYGWNNDFALMVSNVRDDHPGAFTGAEIIDAENAWVAFASSAPPEAIGLIDDFSEYYPSVSVEVRPEAGFTEVELEEAVQAVHYSIFGDADVSSATTLFDFETQTLESVAVLPGDRASEALEALHATAIDSLVADGQANIVDHIEVSLTRSDSPVLGGDDDSSQHIGGEVLSGCTSGFVVVNSSGTRGISTAGHCGDSQSDDGVALTFQAQHVGDHGDFQWHTGSQSMPNDFYAGTASVTETDRRSVTSVGAPVVDQSLCKNGATNHQDCQEVRNIGVCYDDKCNLVQMGARLAAGGDSGGPVYWGNTAYGLHQGWMYDPAFPADRDLFSRADRLPDALSVSIALS